MDETAPQISVIVVLYNSGAVVERCLAALDRQTRRDFELILVDNDSPDREIDRLVLPPYARVLRMGVNAGFAGGNNAAAKIARGRWLALLNPDAIPEPDWLEQLVAAAERHGAVSVGSLQVMDDDPDTLDGAGDVCHAGGLAWRGGFGRGVEHAPREDCEIFGACGAAALYDRAVFLDQRGFHEPFFCYFEDVDLAFRLRRAGGRVVLAARARVRHVGSATSGGRHSDFAVYHGLRNMMWSFARNMQAGALPLAVPMHVVTLALLLLKNILRGTGRPAWRALRDGIAGLGAALRGRRAVQAKAVPGADLFLLWSPLAPLTRPMKTRALRFGPGSR